MYSKSILQRVIVGASSQFSSDYLPLSPLSSNRKAYRTPGGRNVVYIPASHITVQPPPVDSRQFNISIHEVTVSIAGRKRAFCIS